MGSVKLTQIGPELNAVPEAQVAVAPRIPALDGLRGVSAIHDQMQGRRQGADTAQ